MFRWIHLSKSPITSLYLSLIIGLYLMGVLTPDAHYHRSLLDLFAFSQERLVAHHEWWRLVTCHFFHVNLGHILMNSLSLVIFGSLLEAEIGSFMLLLVCMVAGIGSDISSIIGNEHGIGASGVIYGIEAFYVTMYIKRAFTEGSSRESSNALKTGFALLIINLYYNLTQIGEVGVFAHLGGAWICIALAMLIAPRRPYSNIDWGVAGLVFLLGSGFLIYRIQHTLP